MSNMIAMQASGRLRFPTDRALRERRPIPGLEGYSISQNGYVAAPGEELEEPTRWPFHDIMLDNAAIMLDTSLATASAWLDEATQSRIRSALPTTSRSGDAAVQELEGELQVSRHAIVAVARLPKDCRRPSRFNTHRKATKAVWICVPWRAIPRSSSSRAVRRARVAIRARCIATDLPSTVCTTASSRSAPANGSSRATWHLSISS